MAMTGAMATVNYNRPVNLHALYSGNAIDGKHCCPLAQCECSVQKHSPLLLQPSDMLCAVRAAICSNRRGWKILRGSLAAVNVSMFCQRGRWSRMGQLGCLKERSWFLPLQQRKQQGHLPVGGLDLDTCLLYGVRCLKQGRADITKRPPLQAAIHTICWTVC